MRRIGLKHTQFATATCSTIRLHLLKIGALVRMACRSTASSGVIVLDLEPDRGK